MPAKLLLAGLLLLTAPCFCAELTFEIKGEVTARAGQRSLPLPIVEFKISADPLWGCKTKAELDRMSARNKQEYPAITITGGGKSDEQGDYRLELKVQVPEGKKLPKFSDRQNPPAWHEYVVATVEGSAQGYRTFSESWGLRIGSENPNRQVHLNPIARITGRLISLSNMSPLADTALVIRSRSLVQRETVEAPAWRVTTDARGNFELSDPMGPVGNIDLALANSSLAFASNSKVWAGVSINFGDNDLGNLVVVPGCTVKLRAVDNEDKRPVSFVVELNSADGVLRLGRSANSGVLDRSGIPAGTYELRLISGECFGRVLKGLVLNAGVNDLGLFELEPVRSIQLDIDVDVGQVPAHSSAHAFLLEGTPPAASNIWPAGSPVAVRGSVSGKVGVVAGLFKGRWFVIVRSRDWAPFWAIVDLPMTGKLKATLSLGGSFELNVSDREGKPVHVRRAAVAIIGTPAERWLREVDPDAFRDQDASPGLIYGDHGGIPYQPGPLMPGKYLIRALSDAGIVEQVFEIKAGEHLKLNLTPLPPRIEVTVTRDGRPAAGEQLLLVSTGVPRATSEEIAEVSSDSLGRVVLSFERPCRVVVLLKREKEWLDSAPNQAEKERRSQAFADRVRFIGLGAVARLSIESGGRERTWLTLDVALDNGWTIERSMLIAKLGRSRDMDTHAEGTQSGSKVEFAMLRPGHYWLALRLKDNAGQRHDFHTTLHVVPKAEQTIKVDVELHSVEVSVKLPRGVTEESLSVTVEAKRQLHSDRHFSARAAKATRGECTIKGVPAGDYFVVATVNNYGGVALYGAAFVSVSGNSKAEVTINANQSDLQLNTRLMQGGLLPQDLPAMARATLLDKSGNEVLIGNPPSATGSLGTMRLRGVPVGSYTLRVEATGFQAWQGDVTIQRGETALCYADLEPARTLKLELDRQHVAPVLAQDFTLRVEDATGTELPGTEMDFDKLFLYAGWHMPPTLFITGLDQRASRVRLKFRGFKEAILDLKPSTDAVHSLTLNLEAE